MNDDRIDPGLLQLFDEAASVETNSEAFVPATMARLEKLRRARLYWRWAVTAIIVVSGALLAPYVAEATLTSMDWLVEHLPETGAALASPIGCVCAALIAWRIARHRFG
jgi:hypothetical protein